MCDMKHIISRLTLEEKASLCSGADFWYTKEIPRMEIPKIMFSDGPHGLRVQPQEADHLGINDTVCLQPAFQQQVLLDAVLTKNS